ncbi:MAG: S9 family peptidase [Pseudomonadota bacterium]
MRLAMVGAVLALGSLAWAWDGHEDAHLFDAATVFELEYASDPQISPDGKSIVYVRRAMDIEKDRVRGALWLIDVESGVQQPLLSGGSMGGAPRWSPDGSRIAFLSSRDGGKPDLKVHVVAADRTYSLGQLQEGTSAPAWSPDGSQLAFSMLVPEALPTLGALPPKPEGAEWAPAIKVYDELVYRADGQGYLTPGDAQVFVVPVEGGTPRQVTELPGGLGQVSWLDGENLLAVGNPDKDRALQASIAQVFRVPLDGSAPVALTGRDGSAFAPKASPDGKQVAYLFQPDGEKTYQQTELIVMDRDGSGARSLTERYDRSPGSLSWRPDGAAVLSLVDDRGEVRLVEFTFDGEVRTRTDVVGSEGVGRPYSSGSFSVAKDGTLAFTAKARSRPAEVGMIPAGSRSSDAAKVLTALNEDALGHRSLAEVLKVQVPSSVGDHTIDAWIALPPGFERNGSAPLLLEIHGGPYAMYGDFFSAEVERYAAEGYVTVWTNPRGSTGYGREFAQEIDLAYPGEDYDDLISVVNYLVEEKFASKDRLFVTGGSGGGVLTAWIVGNTDMFAAAASVKPVINWTSETLSADLSAYAAFEWLREMPWENQELYWSLSPLSRVGNVTTPTLMMTGEEDWRTPTWEAEQFYTALKLQNVDTMMVRVPGASHYISARPSHLIAKTEAIMAWFEKYDPEKDD